MVSQTSHDASRYPFVHQCREHDGRELPTGFILPAPLANAYASALAHGNLAFYQMQILNRYPASYEAFAWLFDHIYHFECFTAEDMKKTLLDNPDVTSYGIQVCIDSAREKYGDSDKLTAAVNWIQNKK